MDEALVHIDRFRMDFGDNRVISDLYFEVRRGETFGFLGSNGSGKTTTVRAPLGIYQPPGYCISTADHSVLKMEAVWATCLKNVASTGKIWSSR